MFCQLKFIKTKKNLNPTESQQTNYPEFMLQKAMITQNQD
jgi:hypothetical protein